MEDPVTFRGSASLKRRGRSATHRCAFKLDEVSPMARVNIRSSRADRHIADALAAHTTPPLEETAGVVTWGADEKVLLALAVGAWLYAVRRPALHPITNHLLAVSLVSSTLPHLIKRSVDETRPNRLTVTGRLHGVPLSGRPRDSFPSGHALHMGALASAAGLAPEPERRLGRALAVILSATRVLLLAHWTSDVVAGFAGGVLLERLMRPITYGRRQRRSAGHT